MLLSINDYPEDKIHSFSLLFFFYKTMKIDHHHQMILRNKPFCRIHFCLIFLLSKKKKNLTIGFHHSVIIKRNSLIMSIRFVIYYKVRTWGVYVKTNWISRTPEYLEVLLKSRKFEKPILPVFLFFMITNHDYPAPL